MKKIICFIKKHKRGFSEYLGNKKWRIECKRCGYSIVYKSPLARLVGTEMKFGFDGS